MITLERPIRRDFDDLLHSLDDKAVLQSPIQ